MRFDAGFGGENIYQIAEKYAQKGYVGKIKIMQVSNDLNQNWLNYLSELNRMLAACQIPEQQTNFWPALGAHIYQEQVYFQSVLMVLLPKAIAENC